MTHTPTIDVSRLIEEQKIGRFAFMLILCTWAVMFTDGYELAAMSYAAPALIRSWHIARAELGPVFAVNLVGIMIGSFVFGYVGDRFGRKRAIVFGTLLYGGLTLVTAWATTLDQLFYLRLLAGVGIGGAVPNAFVLVSEFAPKRQRATWVTVMFTGYTLGASFGGVVSASLIPRFGWQVVFWLGGFVPLAIVPWLYLVMPESLRYLILQSRGRERLMRHIVRISKQLRNGLEVTPHTRFSLSDESGVARFSPRLLFSGRLRSITPVLWLAYIANSMALFFLQNWLPVLIEAVGVKSQQAALVSSMFPLGGTVGALVLMRLVDRRGAVLITILPLVGFPIVATLGMGMTATLLFYAVFAVGFCVAGTQAGLNAVASMVYPTAYRAKGTGTALGVAKIGSISGPMIGGLLLAAHLPVPQLFRAAALPVIAVAGLVFLLGRLYRPDADLVVNAGDEGSRSAAGVLDASAGEV